MNQGRSQKLKQVPQNFMKSFNIDDVTLTSQLRKSYRKINIKKDHKLQSYFPKVITDVKLTS